MGRSRYVPAAVGNVVKSRAGGYCEECRRPPEQSYNGLRYHHAIPFSEGGEHTAENIRLLCAVCHDEKHRDRRALMDRRRGREGYARTLAVSVSISIGEAVAHLAAKRGDTVSTVLREALIRYLREELPEVDLHAGQDALAVRLSRLETRS